MLLMYSGMRCVLQALAHWRCASGRLIRATVKAHLTSERSLFGTSLISTTQHKRRRFVGFGLCATRDTNLTAPMLRALWSSVKCRCDLPIGQKAATKCAHSLRSRRQRRRRSGRRRLESEFYSNSNSSSSTSMRRPCAHL